MRSTLCLLVTVACAGCAASAPLLRDDAAHDNPRAQREALAHFVRGRALEPLALPVLGAGPPYGQVTGTPVGDKGLYAVPSSTSAAPALAYLESECAVGGSCGCEVGAETHVWSERGRVVIARLIPDVEVHTVKVSGSCGYGCGTEPPPPATTFLSLGPIDPSMIEIDDVHYHYDEVEETCDHPIPVP